MELPHIGQHCANPLCKRLDFLPVKCDACQKTFCNDHYSYSNHHCTESYRKDNQVPVCPLCNRPVPIGSSGESPDVVVGRHIDNDCQSEMAQSRRKVYSNRCSLKGCKQKEVMPLMCERCRLNFCLRHRHEMDHSCQGFSNTGRPMSSQGAAAISRLNQSSADKRPSATKAAAATSSSKQPRREQYPTQPASRITAVQAHALQQAELSEDEALRRAMQLSLEDQSNQLPANSSDVDQRRQEEMDEALARALQESEYSNSTSPNRPSGSSGASRQASNDKSSNCSIS